MWANKKLSKKAFCEGSDCYLTAYILKLETYLQFSFRIRDGNCSYFEQIIGAEKEMMK